MIDKVLDWFMVVLIGTMCLILGLGLVGLAQLLYFHSTHTCVRSEKQMVHHPEWTQMISVGNNVMVPVFHSAYDALEDVCLEYRQD